MKNSDPNRLFVDDLKKEVFWKHVALLQSHANHVSTEQRICFPSVRHTNHE